MIHQQQKKSISERVEAREKRQKIENNVKFLDYENVDWVAGTSNIVERLFSKSKKILTPYRLSMKPSTFEMILMLKCNINYWNLDDFVKAYNTDIETNDPISIDVVEDEEIGEEPELNMNDILGDAFPLID